MQGKARCVLALTVHGEPNFRQLEPDRGLAQAIGRF
jgi:hypothetical protein